MCGESWHAMKDSLTHRPSSQGWAPGVLPFLYKCFVCLLYVLGWKTSDHEWKIKSGEAKWEYTVTMECELCQELCQLICKDCEVCIHIYVFLYLFGFLNKLHNVQTHSFSCYQS